MYNVYKVTAAKITRTKSGYDLYNLELDKSIRATKLVPLKEMEKRWEPLYKLYEQNSKSLEFLVGRYISVYLEESKFGVNFSNIASFEVLQDFNKLLMDSSGKAFVTNINIFDFLKKKRLLAQP